MTTTNTQGAAILYEHEDGRYAVNPDTTGDPAWHRLGPVDISALAASAQSGLTDAYAGAREDLSIWKRRALEAERDLRSEKQTTSRLVGELNAANGPAYMGEPAASPAYGATEYGWADYRRLQDGDKRLIALVVGLYGNDHQSSSDLEGLLDRASRGQVPAQQPAPSPVPAEWLEQAFREGWAACRDSEFVGEEAEEWAFGSSQANGRMIDIQQAAPTAQADTQPADYPPLPSTYYLVAGEIRGWDEHQMRTYVDADRAARATAERLPVNWMADVERVICRMNSSDPDFDDCADAVALIIRLTAEVTGPKGYATWKDAAVAERIRANSVLEDAARLDWLIEQRAYVVSDPDACPGHWLHWARPDGSTWVQGDEHPTPRAAIDAARKQGEKQ